VKKKPATKAEKAWMNAVESLGCCVSDKNCGGGITLHHVRHAGETRKHNKVIPLCQQHHQDGGYGVAIEAGKRTWRTIYDDEETFLDWAKRAITERGVEFPV